MSPPAAVSLLFGLIIAPASAVDSGTDLAWSAPVDCPDTAEVDRRIRALAPIAKHPVAARARVQPQDGGGFELELRVTAGGSTDVRVVSDGSCDALADLTSLTVAIARDPEAGSRSTPAEDPPDEDVEPLVVPLPQPPPAAEPFLSPVPRDEPTAVPPRTPPRPPDDMREPPRPRRRRALEAGVSAGLSGGVLPRFTGLVGGTLDLVGRTVWGGARVLSHLPRRSEPVEGIEVVTLGTSVGAYAGGVLRLAPTFELRPGAGAELVLLRGRGRGLPVSRSGGATTFSIVPSLAGVWVRQRLGLGLRASMVINPIQARFRTSTGRVVATTPRLGGRAELTVAFRFALPIK